MRKENQPLSLLYIEISYHCEICIIKGTKLLIALKGTVESSYLGV